MTNINVKYSPAHPVKMILSSCLSCNIIQVCNIYYYFWVVSRWRNHQIDFDEIVTEEIVMNAGISFTRCGKLYIKYNGKRFEMGAVCFLTQILLLVADNHCFFCCSTAQRDDALYSITTIEHVTTIGEMSSCAVERQGTLCIEYVSLWNLIISSCVPWAAHSNYTGPGRQLCLTTG